MSACLDGGKGISRHPNLEGFIEPHLADILFRKRCHGKVRLRYSIYISFFSNTCAEL